MHQLLTMGITKPVCHSRLDLSEETYLLGAIKL